MSPAHKLTVERDGARQRLDRFLTALGTWGTRSQVQRLITHGLVRLDGQPAKPGAVLRSGQHIEIEPAPVTVHSDVRPAAIPLEVLYEDAWLLVIDKPAGLVVHPAPGNWQDTLVSALLHRWEGRPSDLDPLRPGIVHRLDKDTSGVLLIAKDAATLADLARQFHNREVRKEYLALVWGSLRERRGEVAQPIGRHPVHRKRMSVRAGGRAAVTRFEVVAHNAAASLLRVWPQTGRTHQIRVHLAALGHSIVGDAVYGAHNARAAEVGMRRQALHAVSLTFQHPHSGESVCVTAPMPADMQDAYARLRLSGLTSREPSSSVFARNAPRPSDSASRILLGQRSPR
ncbi:MAG TPA: RluA family pseudouridine synthase, partial [Pseudomonadales bacterium]|nr:RluA family pseudouridine synthase [Pseudomonadales bacterium]